MVKKHILHVISSLQRGGAETVLLQLIKGLREHYTQSVIYLHDGPYRHELELLQIPHYHLAAPGGYLNPLIWYRLYKLLKQLQPDLIHSSLWAANLMTRLSSRLVNIPVVASLHALVAHEGPVRTMIDRCTLVRFTPAIATSQTIAQSMVTAGKYHAADMTIIPSGIDGEQLQHQAATAQHIPYYKEAGAFLVGAVGRLVAVKNYDLLIDAVAALSLRYPFIRLLIIGTGLEEDRLRAQVAEHGMTQSITMLTHQVAAPYYQQFDCFVMPSVHEGLGLATLEAQFFRVPVIVTEQFGSHEVVQHTENGLIVPPHNKEALSYAIQHLMNDTALRLRLAEAGHQTVMRHFTAHAMIQHYQRCFEQRLSRNGNRN